MGILKALTKTTGLVVPPAVPPLNQPPQWDSQPSVTFTFGTGAVVDLNDITSDPDLDAITFSLNTGAVSLPTGVTWNAGAGTLTYDGVGAVATTSGHIATINDGTDSVNSSAFDIAISDTWPARWPQARGAYTISDGPNVLDNSDYTTWTFNNDCLIFRGIYPTSGLVTEYAGYLAAERSNYPDCKFVEYCIPTWGFEESNTGTVNHRRLQRDTIVNAGAEDEWYLKHPTLGTRLWGSNDQDDAIMVNVSDECPQVGGETFNQAYTREWFAEFSSGSNMVQYLNGVYFDGIDRNNAFPQPVIGEGGADYDGVPDYNDNGSADDSQSDYRAGCIELATEFETVATTSYSKPDWLVVTNGGRDYSYSDGTLSSYQWYESLGHVRVMEGADSRLRIENDGAGGFETGGSMNTRLFGELVQAAMVSYNFCIPEATSGFRRYCLIDYPIYHGGTGLAVGDLSEDDWKLQEFLWAVCISTEEMMYGVLINKRQPAPDLDLYNVDVGDPLATRSLGTLSADGETFTERTADSTEDGGQWYITEFDNGFAWFNADPPTNNSSWPQPGSNATLSADFPTPPSGKKGQYINGASYNNYGSSRNDGSDVTSITAGPFEGGWVSWVDV